MSLKPDDTIERILISSTCRFSGEYSSDEVLITDALPGLRNPERFNRLKEGPFSRSAYVLSFVVQKLERAAGVVIPDYEWVGEWMCSLLSLLYGKRFDCHGPLVSHGDFRLPRLQQFDLPCLPSLPQNEHRPRNDIAIPLDLREVSRIQPMMPARVRDQERADVLNAAAKFYHQALQNAESDAAAAYLHLISAGEILANACRPQNEDLIEDDARAILDQVRRLVPDGERAARLLAHHIRQIKRRFRSTIEDLMDERFYVVTEHSPPSIHRLNAAELTKRVSAAYDMRSRYVHRGFDFGPWVAPRGFPPQEVQSGRPVVDDNELSDLLQAAPTYVGLERVIRFCLIRFAETHGLFAGGTAQTG